MNPLVLHEDRFFDAEPSVRRVARTLYEETRALPLICPHELFRAAPLLGSDRFRRRGDATYLRAPAVHAP